MATYRYWRIYITDTTGSNMLISPYEAEFRGSVGGADLCNGGTALSSHSVTNIYKLFDNNTSTYFNNGSPGVDTWFQYDFGLGNEVDVKEIAMLARYSSQMPKDFKLQYSDNGTDFTDVATWTNETWTGGAWKALNIPGPPAKADWSLPFSISQSVGWSLPYEDSPFSKVQWSLPYQIGIYVDKQWDLSYDTLVENEWSLLYDDKAVYNVQWPLPFGVWVEQEWEAPYTESTDGRWELPYGLTLESEWFLLWIRNIGQYWDLPISFTVGRAWSCSYDLVPTPVRVLSTLEVGYDIKGSNTVIASHEVSWSARVQSWHETSWSISSRVLADHEIKNDMTTRVLATIEIKYDIKETNSVKSFHYAIWGLLSVSINYETRVLRINM